METNVTLGTTPHHACGCGSEAGTPLPVLDARALAPELRHGAIFGALEGAQSGRGIVLIAPHDPIPLLAQVEDKWPGQFAVEYLERDSEWRLAITRNAAASA